MTERDRFVRWLAQSGESSSNWPEERIQKAMGLDYSVSLDNHIDPVDGQTYSRLREETPVLTFQWAGPQTEDWTPSELVEFTFVIKAAKPGVQMSDAYFTKFLEIAIEKIRNDKNPDPGADWIVK